MSKDFSFLKDNVDLMILNALFGGDKYGYEISKEISDKTSGQYLINSSTLYSYLKRLNADGLVEPYWGTESNGGRRRYYTLTEKGREFCRQTSAQWTSQKTMIDSLVLNNLTMENADRETFSIDSAKINNSANLNNLHFRKIRRHRAVDENSMQKQQQFAKNLQQALSQNSEQPEEEEQKQQFDSVFHDQQENFQEEVQKTFVDEVLAQQKQETSPQNPLPQEEIPTQKPQQFVQQSLLEQINDSEQDLEQQRLLKEQKLRIFDVVQDDADLFIKQFDQSASIISSKGYEQQEEDDHYKRMFDTILSEQLEEMEKFNDEQPQLTEFGFANNRPLALEEVANQLAKEGVRVRIFNATTAAYKPKQLFPTKKVYCLASWCAISAVILLLGILCVSTLKTATYPTFLVTMGILLSIPLIFSVLAIVDPIRKVKPDLNFRTLLIVSCITSAVVILLSFGINILLTLVQFSDIGAVATQIGIPSIVSLTLPFAALFVKLFFTRYNR